MIFFPFRIKHHCFILLRIKQLWPTVVLIEDVTGLSRANRKEAEKARAAARDGVDRPARPAAVGHIPILRSAENLTIVPMKQLELWQGWAQRRGLDPTPQGEWKNRR